VLRIWLQRLATVWVALNIALAGFAGPFYPWSACATTIAFVDGCNHERNHPGTPSACSDHCRASPMAAMEQPAPPAPLFPTAARLPAASPGLAGLVWDVPVRPPKRLA
jgi:hypothetical protein